MKEEKQFKPKAPDYKGNGVDIWRDTDKNGDIYLRVSVLGSKVVCCFKNVPKQQV